MMWKRMLARFRPEKPDEALKSAALRETARIQAELERMDIRIEMATRHTIKELEQELRQSTQEPQ